MEARRKQGRYSPQDNCVLPNRELQVYQVHYYFEEGVLRKVGRVESIEKWPTEAPKVSLAASAPQAVDRLQPLQATTAMSSTTSIDTISASTTLETTKRFYVVQFLLQRLQQKPVSCSHINKTMSLSTRPSDHPIDYSSSR